VKDVFIFRKVAAPIRIGLTDTTVGTLSDDLKSWPQSGLLLDGFEYSRISEASMDAMSRLKWLRRSRSFGRQPYQQLAKVLRQEGDEAAARKVLIAMEDDPRRLAALPFLGRFWAEVLRRTINYGYDPLRAVFWIIPLVLLGFVLFGMGYRAGLLTPSDKEAHRGFVETGLAPAGYEQFCAIVYSLDTFVPLIDLGQRGHWILSPTPTGRPPGYSNDNLLVRVACDAMMTEVLPRDLWPSTTFMRFYRWVHIVFGWFFTTMFVAGVTGLVQRR
jgi:hypothetical protein